jgi:tRNA U34 5-methylaminomethyl-2-thiouridine-forming methyltransferase MnmC
MSAPSVYRLVRLANDTHSVHYERYGETLHPVAGPVAEAEALYVGQLRLRERIEAAARHFPAARDGFDPHPDGEFVIWDVGLGAGGNALTVLRCLDDLPARVRLVSFDETPAPLRFALDHRDELGYLGGFETAVGRLLECGRHEFNVGELRIHWALHIGDFPAWLNGGCGDGAPAPHAVLFDPFSPAKNPAMWTRRVLSDLARALEPHRPCALATYSRSTLVRTTLLLAGFFVGVGAALPGKEETTVAANDPALIAQPLDHRWLAKARASRAAEPLTGAVYRQLPLDDSTWRELQAHPQFR